MGGVGVVGGGALMWFLVCLSVLVCLSAIVVWFFFPFKYAPVSLGIFTFFLLIALVAEGLMQRLHGRRIVAQDP